MCRGMVFWRYPMDQHICNLRLASCKYRPLILKYLASLCLSLLIPTLVRRLLRQKFSTTITLPLLFPCNLCALGGYDSSQLRISGQFSYDKTSQRDLQFFTDMRELARDKRTWQGEESRCSSWLPVFLYFTIQRTTACMVWRSS